MVAVNLGTLRRPATASIFAIDPVIGAAGVAVFILTDIAIPLPNRARLDLLKSSSATRSATIARSPLERSVADNIQLGPELVTVQGTLSANPLGLGAQLGGFGSIIRRDLLELNKLRRFIDLREPMLLVIPARIYPSVAITSITETHPGSNKVELSITFEEVRIISPLTVAGALDLDAMLAGASSTSNAGAQPAASVAADVGGGLG
jgi:hypothetical protein